MGQKLKIAGWLTVGALTGALTTFSLQTVARANMAMENISADLAKTVTDKKRPLILVCASGMRSQKAQRLAQQLGYENVHSLGGGLKIWQEANLPLEKA